MPSDAFVSQLNEQIGHEFAAHQQYVAIAVHYEAETLPRLAHVFYGQALEERGHAMMMIRYLLDAGSAVVVPGVEPPRPTFDDIVSPVALALEQEQRVSDQINALAATARAEGDYASEQFMQWFIKEQVEEVSKMNDLLTVVGRSLEDPMRAEEYIARERFGDESEDASAPPQAGEAG
jgi:ferritin